MTNDPTETHPSPLKPSSISFRTHKIHVEIVRGPDSGRTVELPGPEVRIGSGVNCDLLIKDRTVSRVHIILRVQTDSLRVIDADSHNGTTIDGTMIHDAYARPDSVIRIGKTTLRMRMLSEMVEVPLSAREQFGRLVGRSVAMRRVFALLERFAPADTTILIEGETGTGKDIAAQAIHNESRRAKGPFIIFDCSGFPPAAIAVALFGQARGAHSRAAAQKGYFEQADGGTLFLDEIAELPIEVQPKLLRAIDSHTVVRVGENGPPRSVDVRIIAATNQNLSRAVDLHRFRDDLYYRLAVATVRMPPLRERPDDIRLLVEQFEREYVAMACRTVSLPESIIREFESRVWLGNVRELKNQVELTLLMSGGESAEESKPQLPKVAVTDVNIDTPILIGRDLIADAYEKRYLELMLQKTGGNVSRAAELAGVGRRWIQNAMIRHGLRAGSKG